jgi:hypothetical protein
MVISLPLLLVPDEVEAAISGTLARLFGARTDPHRG